MGQIQKSTMETRFVGLCKGRMVPRRPGTADSRLESREKRVMDAVEDYLENCAQVKVDTEVLESLLKLDNLEVSLRYVLKYSTRRGSNVFSSSTHQRSRTTSWQVEDDGWGVNEKWCTATEWAKRVA